MGTGFHTGRHYDVAGQAELSGVQFRAFYQDLVAAGAGHYWIRNDFREKEFERR